MKDLIECSDCGWRTFYERRCCPDCGGDSFTESDPGVGEVLATTETHVTPDGVRHRNTLGLARFAGDANVIAQLEDRVEPGDEVRLTGEFELRQIDEGPLVGPRLVRARELEERK